VESAGTYLLDDPHVKGVVVQTRDITERKRIEEALREAEERFRRVFEDAAIRMALVTADGRFLRTNRSLGAP
jgi:PAS domain-containing protein